MAEELALYMVVHQPRRLKLPAQPIPAGAVPRDIEKCLFDEPMNEGYFRKVARRCYYPATHQFLELVDEGFKFALGFSVSFLKQVERWDPPLLALFQRLVKHENVELVGVDPYHGFLCLVDLPRFLDRMAWAADYLEGIFGKRPVVTDTTEMCMSGTIYQALNRAGFKAGMLDGREWVMGWRDPTHLYHGDKPLRLFTRHYLLSDDVGYRFSDCSWPGWPLMADSYAQWIKQARGDFVFLAWDYETFGEHHAIGTGIFEFLQWLPGEIHQRGVEFRTPSELLEKYGEGSHFLPLPASPSTWAGGGGLDVFLGNPEQQALFQLMLQAYNGAVLTGDDCILDIALWLLQSDNLHTIQWYGRQDLQARVSAYFTPEKWWELGPAGILREQQQVYRNFLGALESYL